SGIIRERAFEEGSLVEKDDVLFRIDPAVYKAEVDAKAASLARAEASRVQALKQSERTETLLERQAASTVTPATVPRLFDLPGRLASTRVAEVRAQVSGIIRERAFEEGSLVEKDDVLFRIDPAVYKAEV
ncbi:efflux transporter periplasmic adaptor subunit, partial [Methylobacterium radiotolerans]